MPLAQRLQEVEIALWLDPTDPFTRDLYAWWLLEEGREEEGRRELSQSLFFSPALSTHSFLSENPLPKLAAEEQQAVEEGLQRALVAGNLEAVGGLGSFYAALGRFADQGRLYEEVAQKEEETPVRVQYLLNAGLAYNRAGDAERAETIFRRVIAAAPQDLRAYQYLATQVFAPRGKLDLAKAVIAEGIQKGADPLALSFSLAEAAQRAGKRADAKAALLQALTFQPSSADAQFRLGLLYLQEQNFDRAALALRKVADLRPDDASAFYHLGLAEEGRYQFFAAGKAYARAVELAPDNTGFRARYEAFQRKVAEQKRP